MKTGIGLCGALVLLALGTVARADGVIPSAWDEVAKDGNGVVHAVDAANLANHDNEADFRVRRIYTDRSPTARHLYHHPSHTLVFQGYRVNCATHDVKVKWWAALDGQGHLLHMAPPAGQMWTPAAGTAANPSPAALRYACNN